jgi:hemin uptake protein HemP
MQGLFMPAAAEPPYAEPELARPRIVTSGDLFGGESEVLILHNGVPYRLRITRQDKLILTK